MEDEPRRIGRHALRVLVGTGVPVLGIVIGNTLAYGFWWVDLVVMVPVWTLFFLGVLFFTWPDRFGRDRYRRDR